MRITEILRKIWLFSATKIKSSESFSKQPTQLIVELNSSLRHIIVTFVWIHFVPFSFPNRNQRGESSVLCFMMSICCHWMPKISMLAQIYPYTCQHLSIHSDLISPTLLYLEEHWLSLKKYSRLWTDFQINFQDGEAKTMIFGWTGTVIQNQ